MFSNNYFQQKMESLGLEIVYMEGDEYTEYLNNEDAAIVSMVEELGWA